jgi:hypothetical protein
MPHLHKALPVSGNITDHPFMKRFLENINTFLVELIGLVGGLFWARNTNWDWEPIILIAVSIVGITIFILLKLIANHEDKPIVELELTGGGGYRSPPGMIMNMSPMDETGQYFIMQIGATYFFTVKKRYDLIIRNNSKNNAYNLNLYNLNTSYPIQFKTKYNSLEPLTIDKPLKLEVSYEVNRPMTHADAEKIMQAKIPEDLVNLEIIAEYKSESRKTFYTKFTPPNINELISKAPNFEHYDKI